MTAKAKCTSCQTRPTTSESPEGQLCQPCLTSAEWENQHSDFDHEGARTARTLGALELRKFAARYGIKNAAKFSKVDLLAEIESKTDARSLDSCWVCNPELDESAREYVERKGTSRTGMKLHVTLRATGPQKAEETKIQLGNGEIETVKNVTTLTAVTTHGTIVLRWDANGRYLYPLSAASINGKIRKVRNVSEALRLAA